MDRLVKIVLWIAAAFALFLMFKGCTASEGGNDRAAYGPRLDEKVDVRLSAIFLQVNNRTGMKFTDCSWNLDGFTYAAPLERGEAGYPLRAFADDDGRRFNPIERRAKVLKLSCREPKRIAVYRSWN